MGMLRCDTSGSLILKIWGYSLGVTMSFTATYGMGGRWDSCPFLHSESFNSSGDLREVLILACCQSPVPSRSFLKEDFGRTCRNPAIWMVAWRFTECKNFLVPKNLLVPILHVQPIGWSGTEKFGLLLNALLGVSRVLNSKCPKQRAEQG
jgi:hypothetical protein